ncbi:MAG: MauE/DoxX family redox-associated membrane protein [Balneolaceae bacterium]
MNGTSKIFRFWINAPRFVMIIIFALAIVGKITSPGAFFTMTNALNPPLFATETLYSLLIATEITLIGLLIFNPDTGIIWSAVLLLFFTIGIGILHAIGIRDLCGCFGDFLVDEINNNFDYYSMYSCGGCESAGGNICCQVGSSKCFTNYTVIGDN